MQFANSPFAFAESVKTQRSPASFWTAIGAHVVVLLVLFALAAQKVTTITKVNLFAPTIEPPPLTLPFARSNTGSGSQGANSLGEAGLGHPPRVDNVHLAPPMIQPVVPAQLQVAPTVDVQMATNNISNLGLTNATHPSVNIGVGKGSTVGDGDGHTFGVGNPAGPGSGTGPIHAGTGGVRDPVLVHSVEPEFSEAARRAKFSGNVQVYLWIDELGNPSHIRVIRGIGMGLDEKAVEAVRQYKFKPATKDGKPMKVDMYINVDFSIF
jgi:protein TonB